MLKVLLISAYDALSHRRWRRELAAFLIAERMEVHQVSLPDRHYSWRSRGSALTLAFDERLERDFDLVIATSMTDLSALRGMHRRFSSVPAIVYFHENQFAYPDRSRFGLIDRQLTSVYTALSADIVVFNSRFNRESFLQGAAELLRKMPDGIPAGVCETIERKSSCLPVAVDSVELDFRPVQGSIVWNHRWEHDKGLSLLLEIARGLIATGFEFQFSLLGQQFRQTPDEINQVIDLLKNHGRLLKVGFIESEAAYLTCLNETQIVLSTSAQEFQGLAVQDALAHGCLPVVPDALCYPEYVPDVYRYNSVDEAVQIIKRVIAGDLSQQVDLSDYGWSVVGDGWLALIHDLVRQREST